jgi:hypothetical protein
MIRTMAGGPEVPMISPGLRVMGGAWVAVWHGDHGGNADQRNGAARRPLASFSAITLFSVASGETSPWYVQGAARRRSVTTVHDRHQYGRDSRKRDWRSMIVYDGFLGEAASGAFR